ncbi:MAG: pantoate--beta-alanine ligase [Bdellovibrionales bacterium]|nr:pantoate--beta-alanine ligase [Bdellovibrionales bacterium]
MTIQICRNIDEIRSLVKDYKSDRKSIGFVPTMGFLHEGHLELVKTAKKAADFVVVSIFVNPAQFNNSEDLKKYPRDEARDIKMLEQEQITALFLPTPEMFYPKTFQTWVDTSGLTQKYEGEFRPGHFKGVTTVVSILFNLIQPDLAVFGEKDFQQLRVIEQMVEDLKFPIDIIRGKTIREVDGLAKSSRNVRLSKSAREKAKKIYAAFRDAQALYRDGFLEAEKILEEVNKKLLNLEEAKLEYLALVDENLEAVKVCKDDSRILIAIEIEGVRLIDNCTLRTV